MRERMLELQHEGSLRAARLRGLAVRASRAYVDETRIDVPKLAGTIFSRALPQLSFNRIRTAFLRAMGLRIGARSLVMGPLDLTGVGALKDIAIGEDSFITGPMRIDIGAPVHMGNRVHVGQDVLLLTVDHDIGPSEHRCGARVTGEIVIQDGVWIGSRVTILPGTVIGKGAVIAAGSVVTADVPSNKLVAGAPARVVRDLDDPSPASTRRRCLAPMPQWR
jgi:maltose O-acetyltransferase